MCTRPASIRVKNRPSGFAAPTDNIPQPHPRSRVPYIRRDYSTFSISAEIVGVYLLLHSGENIFYSCTASLALWSYTTSKQRIPTQEGRARISNAHMASTRVICAVTRNWRPRGVWRDSNGIQGYKPSFFGMRTHGHQTHTTLLFGFIWLYCIFIISIFILT